MGQTADRSERPYTVDEANRLLPVLAPVLEALRIELRTAADRDGIGRVRRSAVHNGGGTTGSDLMRAGRRAERHVDLLLRHGVRLRDPERGLVDFPAVREGRPIFLCWRLGEPQVAFWHARDQGFDDRRPL